MKELVDRIEPKLRDMDFSGVISIFERDSAVYTYVNGYRCVSEKLPIMPDTKFGIASGTKFLTALGIGKLIDMGKLSLDSTMKGIDKDFKGFIDENATILNLLTHTSGMYDYYDEELIEDFDNFYTEIPWYQLETPSNYFSLFHEKPMKFTPGTRYSYSNGGYVFLGIIIERITGEFFRDFINENILNPAQMDGSGFYSFNDLPPNTALGYKNDGRTTNIYNVPIRGGGDGGMYTTTDDLRSFWRNLFNHELLSRELTEKFLQTHVEFNERSGYGCGVYKRLDDSMFMIVGGDAGVGFDSRYLPDKDITINILSNITEGECEVRKVVLAELDRVI